MTKRLILFFLITFLAGSCAPTPASLTPPPIVTITLTVTPSPTLTPEPTAIPETAEQIAYRLGKEAGLRGEPANNWQLWSDSEYRSIKANPAAASVDQLNDLDTYMYGNRQGDFEKFLGTNEGEARDILRLYYLDFLPDSPDVTVISTLPGDQIIDKINSLTPQQMELLDYARRAYVKEKNMPSPNELMKRRFLQEVMASTNIEVGRLVPGSGGWYGINMKGDPTFLNTQSYTVSMFGKEVTNWGYWDNESWMDLLGVEDLSYGIPDVNGSMVIHEVTGVTGFLRANQNDIIKGAAPFQLVDFIVVPSGSEPIIFDEGTKYPVGGWSTSNGFTSTTPLTVLNKTLYTIGAVKSENLPPLTLDVLFEHVQYPQPQLMFVRSADEHAIDATHKNEPNANMIQAMFFHPYLGVPVVAESDREHGNGETGIIFFTTYNSWHQ